MHVQFKSCNSVVLYGITHDNRDLICNKVCFIDGYAYVAGGRSEEKAEKYDYKEKKWKALPDYPIRD